METNYEQLKEIIKKLSALEAHTGSLVISMIQLVEQIKRIADKIYSRC